jgi:hypothetical protein
VSASGFIYFEQTIPETLRRKKKQAGKQEKAEHFKAFSWETVTGTEFEDTTELSKASQPMEWSQPWNQEIGDLAKIRADCSGGKVTIRQKALPSGPLRTAGFRLDHLQT